MFPEDNPPRPDVYDDHVAWIVVQDDRKRHPRYKHYCHQCGLITITWSKTTPSPKSHEQFHRTMDAIQKAEAEMEDTNG